MLDDCIFCRIASGKIPVSKVYENGNFFSVPDISPIIKGHSLIISKQHFETTLDLPDDLAVELLDCIKKTVAKLMKENNADGFNILNNNFESAGQVVKHFHLHLLPRKKDDGFKIVG